MTPSAHGVRAAASALAIAAVSAVVACSDAGPSAPSTRLLTTDSASYVANPIGGNSVDVRVITTLRNASPLPMSLPRCTTDAHSPIYSVELTPGEPGTAAYDPAWGCVGGAPPLIVAPGAVRVDTLLLRGPAFGGSDGKPIGLLEGSFRIVYGGEQSNAFRITLPPSGLLSFVPRDTMAYVQTDSLVLHMTGGPLVYSSATPLRMTIYNPRPDTTFIVNCDGLPAILEKQVAGAWVAATDGAGPACLSAPIVIPPNARIDTSMAIVGAMPGTNGEPAFKIDYLPGVYRVVIGGMYDSFSYSPPPLKFGNPVPVVYGTSNPFLIIIDQ